jgi:hypothetical protein
MQKVLSVGHDEDVGIDQWETDGGAVGYAA